MGKAKRKRETDLNGYDARMRKKRYDEQKKTAAVRAKYGPLRRPSPVTVRSLETGEVLAIRDQSRWNPRRYSPLLDEAARVAGFDGYAAYIASAYWQTIRERVLERDGRQCRICQGRSNLTVHHDRYAHIGCEELVFLKTICARCHRRIHR